MHAVQAYLEGIWGEAAARFRLVAENTGRSRGPMTGRCASLRRRLPGRARLRRVDLGDRYVVAARPHRQRATAPSRAQGGVGGRIYERTPTGDEHDWGKVTAWEPPPRLAYLWHIGRDRAEATEVEIRSSPGRRRDPGRDRAPGLGAARRRGRGAARPEPRRVGRLLPHFGRRWRKEAG